MGCINKLTAAVSYDCTNVANRAKSGLEAKAVLINKSDIDLTTLTQSGATVTSMLLTSEKLVLMLVGLNKVQLVLNFQ
jgi:hypothetical protein